MKNYAKLLDYMLKHPSSKRTNRIIEAVRKGNAESYLEMEYKLLFGERDEKNQETT